MLHRRLPSLIVLAAAGVTTLATCPAAALTDTQLQEQRTKGFAARRDEMLGSLRGKPFELGYVSPNRLYVRPQSYAHLNFAYGCFLLGERLEEANRAVVAFCDLYRDNLSLMVQGDSYYWAGDVLFSMLENYGSRGRWSPGRITSATEERVLKMLRVYARAESRLVEAEYQRSRTWDVWGSENHHIQKFAMLWHSSKFLMAHPVYRNERYDDGHTPAEHYAAWSIYIKHWMVERAKKGMFVEFANEGYNMTTLKGIYNFHDFGTDPEMRQIAGSLLTVFWAEWGQEQLDGIRGGSKARLYPGRESHVGGLGSNAQLSQMLWYYTGVGSPLPPQDNLFTAITSTYRPPLVVMDILMDTEGRGTYEITQRRLGLAKDKLRGPPVYRFDQKSGGLVRYSYCTPDFILGAFHCAARREIDWTMVSSQNRWMGANFSGDPRARVFFQCDPGDHRASYNALWGVQSKGTLIARKLPGGRRGMSKYAGDFRVWLSDAGRSNLHEQDGWVFADYGHAHVAVRVVHGGYDWQEESGEDWSGRWLVCQDDTTPVILEVARKKFFKGPEEFRGKILALAPILTDEQLEYRSLYQQSLTMPSDFSRLPAINGQPVNLAPRLAMDSPYLQTEFDSGIVTIRKGPRVLNLTFQTR